MWHLFLSIVSNGPLDDYDWFRAVLKYVAFVVLEGDMANDWLTHVPVGLQTAVNEIAWLLHMFMVAGTEL